MKTGESFGGGKTGEFWRTAANKGSEKPVLGC